jgi:hypothetical protein
LSPKVRSRLEALFSGSDLDEAVQEMSQLSNEMLALDVIKLSEGELSHLKYFVERARSHPSDIFILANRPRIPGPLPEKVRALLQGGPVAVPDLPYNPSARGDDLWDRDSGPFNCVVCGKVVSTDPRQISTFWLSKRRGVATSGKAITAHSHCTEEGKLLAHSQGYRWLANTFSPGDPPPR